MVNNLYKRALMLKGETSQIDICIEELAELMQALIKHKRKEGYEKILIKDNIIEEICDVEIMIEQMVYTFDIEKECKEMKEKKLKRLKERLDILTEEK